MAQNTCPIRLKLLTARLVIGEKSDSEKVEKINKWITRHIKYDVKGFVNFRENRWSIKKILRKRKGLCKEYAYLFDAMCKQSGIPSITINGYSKNFMTDESDIFFIEDHCWNTFKADGKWYLSDLTWASGILMNKFRPWYVWEHKLKLRRFPFKIQYKRSYSHYHLFTPSTEFWLTHHPNKENYQLLNSPFSLDEFENLIFRDDTLKRYDLKNIGNSNNKCDYCETQVLQNEVTRNYTESKEHLTENPRNNFSFVHHFVAYDKIHAEENPSDTNFVKDEIKRYTEMLPFLNCANENINLDYKINTDQVSHKNRLFKSNYLSLFKTAIRQNQKDIRTNRYFLRKNSRYLFNNQLRYFFKYKSLLFYRIINPIPHKVQTKRDKKLLARYTGRKRDAKLNATGTMNNISGTIRAIDSKDSLIRFQLLSALKDYDKNTKLEEILRSRMAGFDDSYDLDIIQIQDTIISIAHRISAYLNNVEVEIKNIYGFNKLFIKNHFELVNYLRKYKQYIIKCERHSLDSKPYKIELSAVDTIISNMLNEFSSQIGKRKSKISQQLNINYDIKILKNKCRGYMNEQYFYHNCRTVFEKRYFKSDRRFKKTILKNDIRYHRIKLKVLNKQLKKERRKALRKKK